MATGNQPKLPPTPPFQYQFNVIGPTQVLQYEPTRATDEANPPSQLTGDESLLPQRKRIIRACDECRRKKIKCDGDYPCIHCKVFFYDCTYDNSMGKRKRNHPTQNVEVLENRLRRMETFIATLVPDTNTSNFDGASALKRLEISAEPSPSEGVQLTPGTITPDSQGEAVSDDHLFETMVTATGRLVLEGRDKWRYTGNSSYGAFLERMRAELGDYAIGLDKSLVNRNLLMPRFCECEDSRQSAAEKAAELPAKETALALVDAALDDACALDRFVHRPTFDYHFARLYELDPREYGAEENEYLPLVYAVLALGCLFWERELKIFGYEHAARKGRRYLNACQQMLDISNCNDLTSLQAIVFMNMFFLCTSRVMNCYSYVGFALTSALRMGLHRSIDMNIDLVEKETHKRTFWVVRNMNLYVATALGLPRGISDEEIDQQMPTEVDDTYITKTQILNMPKGVMPLISASNFLTMLLKIQDKLVHHIYPTKGTTGKSKGYMVSHLKVRELEKDLQEWKDGLPAELRPGGDPQPRFRRASYLLHMWYAHVQFTLYRPFLHYISKSKSQQQSNLTPAIYAVACINASRNIIQIIAEMNERQLLHGAYHFPACTVFHALITLIFTTVAFTPAVDARAILNEVEMGRRTLASVAFQNLAAERCTKGISIMMDQLPNRLKVLLQNGLLHPENNLYSSTSSPEIGMEKIVPHTSLHSNDAFTQAQHAKWNGQRSSTSVITNESDLHSRTEFNAANRIEHGNLPPSSSLQPLPSREHSVEIHSPDLDMPTLLLNDPFLYPNQPLPSATNHPSNLQAQPMFSYPEDSDPQSMGRVTENTLSYDDLEAQPSNFGRYFLDGPHDDVPMHGGMDSFNEQLDGLFENYVDFSGDYFQQQPFGQ